MVPNVSRTFNYRWVQDRQQFVRGLLVQPNNRVIQGILVLVQPASDVVVHSTSIVHQGEVGLSLALCRLGLLKCFGLAKMLVIQLVLEGNV